MVYQYHITLLHYLNTMEIGKKICCLCNNTLLKFYLTKIRQDYFALSSAYRYIYIYSRKIVPPTSQIPRTAFAKSYPLTEDSRDLVEDSISGMIEQIITLFTSSCCLLELCRPQRYCGRYCKFIWPIILPLTRG